VATGLAIRSNTSAEEVSLGVSRTGDGRRARRPVPQIDSRGSESWCATVGRRRSDKPPCCEDPTELSALNEELRELLYGLA
jgi:hypothetical protein